MSRVPCCGGSNCSFACLKKAAQPPGYLVNPEIQGPCLFFLILLGGLWCYPHGTCHIAHNGLMNQLVDDHPSQDFATSQLAMAEICLVYSAVLL